MKATTHNYVNGHHCQACYDKQKNVSPGSAMFYVLASEAKQALDQKQDIKNEIARLSMNALIYHQQANRADRRRDECLTKIDQLKEQLKNKTNND